MIILGKIKVDDQVFKYCEISYEPFYVTIMSEDEKAIVDLFNSAKSIIVRISMVWQSNLSQIIAALNLLP